MTKRLWGHEWSKSTQKRLFLNLNWIFAYWNAKSIEICGFAWLFVNYPSILDWVFLDSNNQSNSQTKNKTNLKISKSITELCSRNGVVRINLERIHHISVELQKEPFLFRYYNKQLKIDYKKQIQTINNEQQMEFNIIHSILNSIAKTTNFN